MQALFGKWIKRAASVVAVTMVVGLGSAQAAMIGIANTAGQVWVRNADLTDAGIADSGYGNTTAMVQLSNNNLAIGNSTGDLRVITPTLAGVAHDPSYSNVASISPIAGGNFVVGSTASGGYVTVRANDSSFVSSDSGYGSVLKVAALTNGNIAVTSNSPGTLRIRSSSLSEVNTDNGYGVIRALAAGTAGRVVVAYAYGSDTRVTVRNADGSELVTDLFPGTITGLLTLNNGNLVIANSGGSIFIRDGLTLGEAVPVQNGFGNTTALAALSDGNFVAANSAGDVRVVSSATLGTLHNNSGFGSVSALTEVVPEPSALGLAAGIAGALIARRRVKK